VQYDLGRSRGEHPFNRRTLQRDVRILKSDLSDPQQRRAQQFRTACVPIVCPRAECATRLRLSIRRLAVRIERAERTGRVERWKVSQKDREISALHDVFGDFRLQLDLDAAWRRLIHLESEARR
jgi:hypothetical protein